MAIEAVRKYGKKNVVLLNHDISPKVEHKDIKRFKRQIADYLDLDITYANHKEWETMTPNALALKLNAFSSGRGDGFCTRELKSKPFIKWLKKHYPSTDISNLREDCIILYGFDADERSRITRKVQGLAIHGYRTDFPLALWQRTIHDTDEIGISKPATYATWRHANCQGCHKAGRQHWYVVFCLRPDLWEESKEAERIIGHSIIKNIYLEGLEAQFTEMRDIKGICPSEKIDSNKFWKLIRDTLPEQMSLLPCDCSY